MNKMFSTLAARISLILIVVTLVFMVAFTVYLVRDRSDEMDEMILQKGLSAARTGATVMERTLNGIIDNSMFSTNEVFDRTVVPIDLPARITTGYAGASEQALASIRKYHYATTLDSYLDNVILEVEDEFLKDPQIAFAVLVDVNGYLPTHNSRYSQLLTGDFARDRDNNRTKSLFDDEVGLRAARNADQPYLKQVYKRDTGEVMWDISAPVFVKGRYWGAFRIGLSMDKAAAAIADLRWKLILSMGLLLLIVVVAINRVTEFMMRPLQLLHGGVERMEKGEIGEDEIARLSQTKGEDEVAVLSRVFAKMAAEVKARETRLKKQVEELRIEIDHTKRAKQVAEITETDYFQNLRQKARQLRATESSEES
ncbi:MAG: HAMP domain-containing protein [Chloroflexi bacterium]|nr:HAMP domain-containing protein [Chloroflexota bacterium]